MKNLKIKLGPYRKAVVAAVAGAIAVFTTIAGVIADGEIDLDDAVIIATSVGAAIEVYRRPNDPLPINES